MRYGRQTLAEGDLGLRDVEALAEVIGRQILLSVADKVVLRQQIAKTWAQSPVPSA